MKILKLAKKQRKFLVGYMVIILGLFITLTLILGSSLNQSKTESDEHHINRMDASITSVEYPAGDYQEVSVGMYVETLRNISIADSSFEAVFYLWFGWDGDEGLDPGSHFQIVGGSVTENTLVSEHYDDGKNYQRYKVTATLDKYYDLSRVSLESHMLNIYIEDAKRDGAVLRFVPDEEQTEISSRVKIPGFKIVGDIQQVVKPHEYKSTYSSPNADGKNRVFSQYVIGITIERNNIGFYLKLVLPFLLSLALALTTLWSRPVDTDSRFGLAGAAFFGVVANAYIISSVVPSSGGNFGLLDMMTTVSLMSVLLIIITSVTSLNIYEKQGEKLFAYILDRAAFICILSGIVIFNLFIPLCAAFF